MRLYELIEKLPKDPEERVEKARKRFNVVVRRDPRQETGLRLNRPGRERAETVTGEGYRADRCGARDAPPLRDMNFSRRRCAAITWSASHRAAQDPGRFARRVFAYP